MDFERSPVPLDITKWQNLPVANLGIRSLCPCYFGLIKMKTMTALEAKTHFGKFLDAAQREPVLVTKKTVRSV
jgi:hypothetical protein